MNNEEKILNLLSGLTNKVDQIQNDVSSMKSDISLIKTQQKEHGEILSSLKTASEFHKADVDTLTHEVAVLSGDVATLKVSAAKG